MLQKLNCTSILSNSYCFCLTLQRNFIVQAFLIHLVEFGWILGHLIALEKVFQWDDEMACMELTKTEGTGQSVVLATAFEADRKDWRVAVSLLSCA